MRNGSIKDEYEVLSQIYRTGVLSTVFGLMDGEV